MQLLKIYLYFYLKCIEQISTSMCKGMNILQIIPFTVQFDFPHFTIAHLFKQFPNFNWCKHHLFSTEAYMYHTHSNQNGSIHQFSACIHRYTRLRKHKSSHPTSIQFFNDYSFIHLWLQYHVCTRQITEWQYSTSMYFIQLQLCTITFLKSKARNV